MLSVSGVEVPVFSPRWLLREKILTAFQRQGQAKSESDLDDIASLLVVVESRLDLTGYKEAVNHVLERSPELIDLMRLKIICPDVLPLD